MSELELKYSTSMAKLMGWELASDEYKINWVGCKTKERLDRLGLDNLPYMVHEKFSEPIFTDHMDYHNSYNSLMDVWFKFRDLDCSSLKFGDLAHSVHKMKFQDALVNQSITEAFNILGEGITWYNDNKKINIQ